MYDIITINNKEIKVKEYNGERVITAWDIADLHEREISKINENFKYNINRFTKNKDYYVLKRSEFSESDFPIQEFIPNNVKEIILFTQLGYLLLTKTFTDDLSWKIQSILIESYFKLKELKDKVESGELKIVQNNNNPSEEINQLEAKTKYLEAQARILEAFNNTMNNFHSTESTVEKKMIIEMVAQATGNEGKFGYAPKEGSTSELKAGSVTATEIAEIMRNKYGLNENFTAMSVGSYTSSQKLKCEPYAYIYYDNQNMSNSYRYFPEHLIPKLFTVIMQQKKRRERYGIKDNYTDDFEF